MLSFTRFATFCAILELISAKSATFTLKLDSSSSVLSGFEPSVHSDGSRIDLETSGSSISGYIDDNGQLIVDDTVMGIGKNYLALKSTSSSWIIAQPFTIVDGKLKLYGSDFHAVPNGEDSGYVLGSINAAVSRSDMIPVAIIPEGADGNVIQNYDTSAQSSSSEEASTIIPTTSTGNSVTSAVTSTSSKATADLTSSSQATQPAISSRAVESTFSSQVTSQPTTSSNSASQSSSSSKAISQSNSSSFVTAQSTSSFNTTIPHVSTFDNGAIRTGVSAGIAVGLIALL
jgi:hypothetical protein